jgi:hypothetical protein
LAQARAERYEEEVKLTVEEMGRTLQYFKWKKSWWQSISLGRSQPDSPLPPDVQAGLRAYADRQSDTYDKLITLFVNHWRHFLSAHSLGSSWLDDYPPDAHPASSTRPRRGHRKLDTGLPTTTNASRRPAATLKTTSPISEDGAIPQKPMPQSESLLTLDDATDPPLDSGSSDEDGEDSDYDLTQDDSWDEDVADDD